VKSDIARFVLDDFDQEGDTWIDIRGEGSIIYVNYKPLNDTAHTKKISYVNEHGVEDFFHKDHMLWKVPSEHNVNNRQYAAELQVTFVQYATSRQLIISFLFDTDLEQAETDPRKLKTCFVDSFEFDYYATMVAAGRHPGDIQVPLKQLINYLPDTYIMYSGSKTMPPCDQSVTWIINTSPHVITQSQVEMLKKLQSTEVQQSGNYREV
jgi:carbonic anhydrase